MQRVTFVVALALYIECDGPSKEIWTLVRELSILGQVAHVPKEPIKHITSLWYTLPHSDLTPVYLDCLWGVQMMTLFALPALEEARGYEFARLQYMKYRNASEQFAHVSQDGWKLETHQSSRYDFIFNVGVEGQYKCEGFTIFIFDAAPASEPVRCSQGMFASEVFLHLWLLNSECRTMDPDKADFFFVPFYAACVSTKDEKYATEMDQLYLKLIQRDDIALYLRRKQGRDFVFLWSSESYDFPSWKEHIPRAIFLSVEGVPIECDNLDFFNEQHSEEFGSSCVHCPSCFQLWKDIIIPGFVEHWSIKHLMKHDNDERELIACYHGCDSTEMTIYKYANTTVRNTIQALDYPGLSVGKRFSIVTDYFHRIGMCYFCFVPKGLGYWSNRLFEVIFAGCIPVILSDEIGLPFGDVIDWPSISIKWPTAEFNRKPYEFVMRLERLLNYDMDKVVDMRAKLRSSRCWLNYHSEDPHCSPYVAITRALAKKKKAFPEFAGHFWGF